MANLEETAAWEAGIYQLETSDPVLGGPPDLAMSQGFDNVQAQQLANRTLWLKQLVEGKADAAALAGKADLASFANSLGANGYQKFPGGLILQWGSIGTVAGRVAVTFPIAFPTACRGITGTHTGGGGAMFIVDVETAAVTKTGFTAAITHQLTTVSNSTYSGFYLAWGH